MSKVNSQIENIYSLTPLQEGMLFHYLENKTSKDYINQNSFEIAGILDEKKIEWTLQLLSQKHEVLRTSIIYEKLKSAKQVVIKGKGIEYEVIDIADSSYARKESHFEKIMKTELERGFDLQKDALFRIKHIYYGENCSRFIFTYHHIIMDGWSISLVLNDFIQYYNRLLQSDNYDLVRQEMLEEALQKASYVSYVKWCQSHNSERALSYWEHVLQDYNEVVGIPSSSVTEHRNEFHGESGCFRYSLETELTQKINSFCKQFGITKNVVLESIWGIILQKYNYVDDVVFAKVVSGRNAEVAGIHKTVGLLVNSIPIRVKTESGDTFLDVCLRVKQQEVSGYEYEFLPLVEIQNRTRQKGNLIQSIFAYENYEMNHEISEMKLGTAQLKFISAREQTNYPISLVAGEENHSIFLEVMYQKDKYTEKEISSILERMILFITQGIENPDVQVKEIELVTAWEQEKIHHQINDTFLEYYQEHTINSLLEEQVAKKENHIALILNEKQICYGELYQRSKQVASLLQKKGIQQGDFVPIIAKRSLEMVIGIVGILLTGAAYVPIDPDYPKERIEYIIEDCKAKVVITYFCGIKIELDTIELSNTEIWKITPAYQLPKITPKDIAYIIYTSGTTGKPKGVMICHSGVVAMSFHLKWLYQIEQEDRILQFANYVFDASVWEMSMALLNGATLVLISREDILDVSRFNIYVKEKGITITLLPPQYYLQTSICNLKVLTTGGSAASTDVVERAIRENKRYINAYGPTENTVLATYWEAKKESIPSTIPIGTPISNCQVYIVQGDKLCGIGMLGELCVAGVGLALGYLNQEKLTQEKFVQNPFGEGRLYRTGDLAQWLEDGTIQYMGRIDAQVKIRGFRIELLEIESALREIVGIKEATVIAAGEKEQQELRAYLVADNKIDFDKVREELKKKLPEYMVPAKMMQIDKIPETSSGKIDIKALPEILWQEKEKYIEPVGEIENVISEAFKEVLGLERIGTQESFFAMGGDSIKAIRIVSNVRNRGYELDVGTIMKRGSISAIANEVRKVDESEGYSQEEVVGEVEETPIMKAFREWRLAKPWHFNQEVMIQVEEDRVEEVDSILKALTDHHDILRAIYRKERLFIRRSGEGRQYECSMLEYPDNPVEAENMIQEACNRIQEGMDLENGPLFKCILFRGKQGNKLFLCAHHLVIDGVSWRILLEDYAHASRQLREGKSIKLPKKTISFQDWAKLLNEYKESEAFQKDKQYWMRIGEKLEQRIPMDDDWHRRGGSYHSREITLKEEETKELLDNLAEIYGVTLRDGLLCALCIAIQMQGMQEELLVGVEGHGREELHRKISLDRTVGWFTTIYPVLMESRNSIEETMLHVKEVMCRVPRNGIGYGLLDWKRSEQPKVYVNYLGEMTQTKEDKLFFGTGNSSAVENGMQGLLNINGWIEGGRLKVNCIWAESTYGIVDYSKISESYKECLEKLVQSLRALKRKKCEKLYPLSALQQGILYHYMKEGEQRGYMIQSLLKIERGIDEQRCKDALRELAKEEVLRTAIQYHGLEMPYQWIVGNREIEYRKIILKEHESYEDIYERDYERGFDLEKDSLIRVQLLKKEGEVDHLLWSYHHIILDGWSMSIIYETFFKCYQLGFEACTGTSYESYISWTLKRPIETGMEYWKKYLDKYDHFEGIPSDRIVTSEKISQGIRVCRLCEQDTSRMKKWLTGEGLTVSTCVETIWGIILQWYGRCNDVAFAKIISGRECDIPNIERMVGLTINSIPVRIQCSDETSMRELLHGVQEAGIQGNQYGTLSLAQIQSALGLGAESFKSLYVFENYNRETIALHDYEVVYEREATNYPVTLIAGMDNGELILELMYQKNQYSDERMERILKQMKGILQQICDNPNIPVGMLEMVTLEETDKVLREFQPTIPEDFIEESILDLWNRQVALHREKDALVFGEEHLSYEKLDAYANCVANELNRRGIIQGDYVPILAGRSMELIIGILGILKAGAAYVPIDLDYPDERIDYIIRDCNAKVVVTYGNKKPLGSIELSLMDASLWKENEQALEIEVGIEDLAYVIYTSGTTGKPKGVMLAHGGVAKMRKFLEGMYQVTCKDRVLQFANHVFDASVWEMTLALLNGAVLVLIGKEDILDTRRFQEYVEKQNITLALLPPQYYLQCNIKGLRVLTTGGSAAGKEVVEKALRENVRYVNAYGPTENTVLATHWEFEGDEEIPDKVPIGKPMWGSPVYILNGDRLCGIGIPGEICITGAGVAKGYLNQTELSQEKFVPNPYGKGKMYRTGDLGRWLEDGNIEYLGRIDEQVKIRGYRIELKEIESVIRENKDVKDVAVLALEDANDEKAIYAYVVWKDGIKSDGLRQDLAKKLPFYMIPTEMFSLEEIPTTKSGKVDHRALKNVEQQIRARWDNEKKESKKEGEQGIQKIWSRLLGKKNIGIKENFFEAGGHSLLITKLIVQLEQDGYGTFTVGEIFANPTIEQQAKKSQEKQGFEVVLPEVRFGEEIEGERRNSKKREYVEIEKGDLYLKLKREADNEVFYGLLFVFVYTMWQYSKEKDIKFCIGTGKEYRMIELEMKEDIEENYQNVRKSYEDAIGYEKINIKVHRKFGGILPIYLHNFDGEKACIEKADLIIETSTENTFVVKGEGKQNRIEEQLLQEIVKNYKQGVAMIWS